MGDNKPKKARKLPGGRAHKNAIDPKVAAIVDDENAPRVANVGIAGKLTPETLESICELHASGHTLQESCYLNRVSYAAFAKYRSLHPEFAKSKLWLNARECFVDFLEDKAHDMAATVDNRSPTMIIFMLKSLRRSRYGERVAVSGELNHSFPAAFAAAMGVETGTNVGQPPTH